MLADWEHLKSELEQVTNAINANSALATVANTAANAANTQAAAAQAAVNILAQKPDPVILPGCRVSKYTVKITDMCIARIKFLSAKS